MQKCPDCHADVDDDAIFCDQCGYRLKPKPATPSNASVARINEPLSPDPSPVRTACPNCGYLNPAGEAFCGNCGVQLSPPVGPAPAAPEFQQGSASPSPMNLFQPRPGVLSCPTCGAENPAGETYCRICGFWLAAQPYATPQPPGYAAPPPDASSPNTVQPAAPLANAPAQPAGGGPSSPFETISAVRFAGRLFATATNASLPLPPKTDIIIGRRDPERGVYPDVDLSGQGSSSNSVSRQHARIFVQGNQVFIEDLNSTNATYLNRQKLLPGQRYLLNNEDELRLGGVVLVYYSS